MRTTSNLFISNGTKVDKRVKRDKHYACVELEDRAYDMERDVVTRTTFTLFLHPEEVAKAREYAHAILDMCDELEGLHD